MEIVLFHLSDIHIKDSSDLVLKRQDKLAAALRSYLTLAPDEHPFLLITGDIAFSGSEDEYMLAENFISARDTRTR
jgi:hypothetical protein